MLALGCHCVFWSLVLFLIESGFFSMLFRLPMMLPKNRIPPLTNLVQDPDVKEEEDRVLLSREELPVKVVKFRKVYPSIFRKPVVAVESTSFSIQYGECFALLGVNGAGKTTTFKALTHIDRVGSSGQVLILGKELNRNFKNLRKSIGYCPQHDDALIKLLTVEEHLYYYARLKGIRKDCIKTIVERQIKELALTNHRTKVA